MVVQHLESNLAQSKQLLAETKCTGYVQAARPIEQGQLGVLTSWCLCPWIFSTYMRYQKWTMFPLKRDSNHQFSGDNYVSFKRPSGHTAIVIVATSMTQLHAESPNNPSLPGNTCWGLVFWVGFWGTNTSKPKVFGSLGNLRIQAHPTEGITYT